MSSTDTTQALLLAPVDYIGSTEISQVSILAVYDLTIHAPYTATTQTVAQAPVQATGVPQVSQALALAVCGEGAREDTRLRAWAFTFDGHKFYVLHLGMFGTLIYDSTTDQWAQWQTEGYPGWNAEQGLNWYNDIVFGDNQNGILWRADPESMLDDDFRPIRRVATAILPARGRQTVTLDSVFVTASVGFPTSDEPLVQLRFSDNYGQTWTDMTDLAVVIVNEDYSQEIAFRSLGSFGAPGRVIEISDYGGVVRIDDASYDAQGEMDG